MIDSSGRRLLRANGTVFDILPVGQTILITGVLFVALFSLAKPEASFGLGLAGRILFWTAHVGLGLGALWVASLWLASGKRLPSGTLPAVLLAGCAGVAIAAPGYLLLDYLYAPYITDVDPDPPAGSLLAQIVGEIVELAPWFLAVWFLINLPVLLPRPDPPTRMNDAVEPLVADESSSPEQPGSADSIKTDARRLQLVKDKVPESDSDTGSDAKLEISANQTDTTRQVNERGQRLLSSLPGIVGTDVVAVASDLHYLNVWTVAGRTTVLGSLHTVVTELGDVGMQVHRSHWVAHAHVRRIVGNSGSASCILSNELRVPVSRRRWKAVREQYGRGVVHGAEGVDRVRIQR
ncbi:MAG: LytTR family DNA-binding domain-containing protein [Granulosicoccus sp.]